MARRLSAKAKGSRTERLALARCEALGACYVIQAHRSLGMFDILACFPTGIVRCIQVKSHTGTFRPSGQLRKELRAARLLLPLNMHVELWVYSLDNEEWREECFL